MTQKKTFHELNLNNAFLFAAALEDSETCRMILEIITGTSISKVHVRAEHTMLFSSDFRSVRFDIYASDEMQVEYNVEMQNVNEKNLPKRSRYHQAELDVMSLKPGEQFEDLKPSYVIFICTFDPFGKGLFRYTFEERCTEMIELPLGDETKKIFLNTKGTISEGIPDVLIHFLKYIEESTDSYIANIEDSLLHELHGKIRALKKSREWEVRYMKFEEMLQQRESIGREEGISETRTQMLTLIKKMSEDGAANQIQLLAEDENFFNEMLDKYNLSL